uniref:Putative bitil peptide n=1 Tax=Rhipicephalus pulchellus TaxID=72859 RepID=L7LTC0_RHIPC
MKWRVLALVFICLIGLVTAGRHHRPRICGRNERPTRFVPRRERFCSPRITRPSLLRARRWCVCKRGFVRNAWGQCIRHEDCDSCKAFPHMDFNVCETDCPLTCGRPIPLFCFVHCVRGCACPPGFVIDRRTIGKGCVSAKICPPMCPEHSSYQQCVSTCEPRCDVLRPKHCIKQCHAGDCVCHKGFAKLYEGGLMRCVPTLMCPKRYEEFYGQLYFVNIGR